MPATLALPYGAWPRARQRAAWAAGALLAGLLLAATVHSAGMLYLALHKANPLQARFGSIAQHWAQPGHTPAQRRRLVLATALPAVVLLVLLPLALVAAARPVRPLHGDARFATPAEVAQAGLLLRAGAGPSIVLGRHRGRLLALGGQLSVLLAAPTRSGKGVGVVVPNLLQWPHSVVVLDVKGENYDITAGYRARHGQAVFAFSPFDEHARSHRWNPLSAVRTSPLHRVGDLLAIGQVFFPNDGSGTSSEAFFNDQARNLFLGLGLLLLESPHLPRTLGELLRQASGKGQPLKDHLADTLQQRREAGNPLSHECADALQRLLGNADNTLSAIVATLNAPLTLFADPVVDAATSADDFYPAQVRRQPISVYVRVPPHRLAGARPLLCLFFSQLVQLNTQHLPEQDPSLKLQCLLVNDEFTAMGRVGAITSAAAYLAGYNLRLLTVVQAMSQLDAVYGEKDARSFATNHGLQVLFAPREQRDADEYSAMLGHTTQSATARGRSRSLGGHGHATISQTQSDQRRALLLPQEIKALGSQRLVLLPENCKPILGEKLRYYSDPAFTARLCPPPPVPAMDMGLHQARVQQRWRHAPDELAPGDTLDLAVLAHDTSPLPDKFEGAPDDMAEELLNFFGPPPAAGGTVQPLPDEHGVLPAPTAAQTPTPDATPPEGPCLPPTPVPTPTPAPAPAHQHCPG